MQFAHWQTLLGRCDYWLGQDDVAGLIVTHGTDTLEETAFFLQAVLQPTKPVAMTCAMFPRPPIDTFAIGGKSFGTAFSPEEFGPHTITLPFARTAAVDGPPAETHTAGDDIAGIGPIRPHQSPFHDP